MQRRVVALLIGAAAVLVLVVVLFIRVRATPSPPTVSPADVIAARSAASAGATPTRPPRVSPLAPPRRADNPPAAASGADQGPAAVGSRASAGARARARLGADDDKEGERGNRFPDLRPDTPPEMIEKREGVSEAYDTGDYETAFRAAQDFLRFQADNVYVLRVAAVSACALGDVSSARMYHGQMSESDKRIVEVRCRRFAVDF